MKVARFHPVRPVQTISELFGTTGSGPSGQVLTATGSNSSSVAWGSNVATITSNGSNVLVGPYVGLQSGSGIAFAASSNILTISSTSGGGGGASVSYGSNATRVSEVSSAGVATTVSSSDHIHDGIGTITASSSNTMQRGTFNLRPGSGIALNLTDTDGDGEFDTATIVNTGSGGGGGAAASGALTFISETVLGSAAAEINITGLPTTYKDLIVVAKFRSATVSTKAIAMRFGDSSAIDTGSNYSFNRRYDGTLANGASQNTSATYMECGALPGSGSTAGFFGAGRWEIIDYASTSRSRIMIGETFDDANDGNFMNSVGGMWKNVTAAVARIRLIVTDGSNFDTNSSITVYGRG
jgi:hypothetical protein